MSPRISVSKNLDKAGIMFACFAVSFYRKAPMPNQAWEPCKGGA